MIAYYFDEDARQLVQSVQSRVQLTPQTWVYGDNYNLQIYITRSGVIQALSAGDTLNILVFQPPATLPASNLILVSSPTVLTDSSGNQYYQVNVNLKTTQLAAITQTPNTPAPVELHLTFNPAAGERFSMSADIPVTVNPDPLQGASGATPVPPGYPASPSVFEMLANKGVAGGYAGLDGNANLNPNKIPTDATLTVTGGQLHAVGAGGGTGNPYVATIPAAFTIPAFGANVSVAMGAAVADMVAGQGILITDGVSSINAIIKTVSGTALTVENTGPSVSGTMNANSHIYMGNSAAVVSTALPGLVPALPATTPTKMLFRGDATYAQANYPDLTNVPPTFPPSTHAIQHVTGGNDVISFGSPTAAGLMPPIDNASITIVGGKLQANLTGAGSNSWVATITGSPAIPAAGNTATYALAVAWPGFRANQSVVITDGAQVLNGIITAYTPATPSITIRNLGTPGTSVSGNFGPTTYVFMGGAPDIATTVAPGISAVDNLTIGISGNQLTSKVNPYIALVSGQQAIPAAGASATYQLTNILPNDLMAGQSVLITDGTHLINGIVTVWANPQLTFRNLGNPGSSISGSFTGATHVYLGNCSDLAVAGAVGTGKPGLVQPDGTTLTISSGMLSTLLPSGTGQHGARISFYANTQTFVTLNSSVALNQFSGKSWDTDSYVSGAAPWTGLTVPAAQAGFYYIEAQVVLNNPDTTGTYRALQLYVGGTQIAQNTVTGQAPTNSRQYLKIFALAWISANPPAGASGGGTWPTGLAVTLNFEHDSAVSGGPVVTGMSVVSGTYLSLLRIS
jgi:hypothetical protein